MIDHIIFGVTDFARSAAFYDEALGALGLTRVFENDTGTVKSAAYGKHMPGFWISNDDPTRGKLHIAFVAADRESVDGFHRRALAAGGTDHGAPGYRPYTPGYYGAFVLDPDGHNVEAVFHDAERS